jgi:hypothetical protein
MIVLAYILLNIIFLLFWVCIKGGIKSDEQIMKEAREDRNASCP